MNIFIFTSKIISLPRWSYNKQKMCIYMIVCLRNRKKSKLSYYIKVFVTRKMSDYILKLYKVGDFVTVEASIKVKLQKTDIQKKYYKNRKWIFMNINKLYPFNYVSIP